MTLVQLLMLTITHLAHRRTEVIRLLSKELDGKLPIIGVGGISNGKDAQEKIDAGATLVQVYTGFIYQGPDLVKDIVSTVK